MVDLITKRKINALIAEGKSKKDAVNEVLGLKKPAKKTEKKTTTKKKSSK